MAWVSGKDIFTKRLSKKLYHRFYKVYPVMERLGMQAYCLKPLHEVGNIHVVFNVYLL
jgi:hypothetical protein